MSLNAQKAEFITMGCRLNAAESNALAEELGDVDNLVVVNSCAVTNEAVRQTRQAIRKARRGAGGAGEFCRYAGGICGRW